MLTQICQYLRNWFDLDSRKNRLPYWDGEFTVADGVLVGFSDRLIDGQHYRIIGSLLNDGVHQHGTDTLRDETFTGTVQSMSIPPDIVALDTDVPAWLEANAAALASPYQSESFGGYSYSLRSSGSEQGGGLEWYNQPQFKARLDPWRKI